MGDSQINDTDDTSHTNVLSQFNLPLMVNFSLNHLHVSALKIKVLPFKWCDKLFLIISTMGSFDLRAFEMGALQFSIALP